MVEEGGRVGFYLGIWGGGEGDVDYGTSGMVAGDVALRRGQFLSISRSTARRVTQGTAARHRHGQALHLCCGRTPPLLRIVYPDPPLYL